MCVGGGQAGVQGPLARTIATQPPAGLGGSVPARRTLQRQGGACGARRLFLSFLVVPNCPVVYTDACPYRTGSPRAPKPRAALPAVLDPKPEVPPSCEGLSRPAALPVLPAPQDTRHQRWPVTASSIAGSWVWFFLGEKKFNLKRPKAVFVKTRNPPRFTDPGQEAGSTRAATGPRPRPQHDAGLGPGPAGSRAPWGSLAGGRFVGLYGMETCRQGTGCTRPS